MQRFDVYRTKVILRFQLRFAHCAEIGENTVEEIYCTQSVVIQQCIKFIDVLLTQHLDVHCICHLHQTGKSDSRHIGADQTCRHDMHQFKPVQFQPLMQVLLLSTDCELPDIKCEIMCADMKVFEKLEHVCCHVQ